jgi:hypothetical protein
MTEKENDWDWWPVEKITPYANNPRNNDGAVTSVAESIDKFGWRQPIVVDELGVILAGHTRLKAAQRLDHKTVPVHVAKGMTETQKKAYRLADNKTGELAGWVDDLLNNELAGIDVDEIDMSEFGFLNIDDDFDLLPTADPPKSKGIRATINIPGMLWIDACDGITKKFNELAEEYGIEIDWP